MVLCAVGTKAVVVFAVLIVGGPGCGDKNPAVVRAVGGNTFRLIVVSASAESSVAVEFIVTVVFLRSSTGAREALDVASSSRKVVISKMSVMGSDCEVLGMFFFAVVAVNCNLSAVAIVGVAMCVPSKLVPCKLVSISLRADERSLMTVNSVKISFVLKDGVCVSAGPSKLVGPRADIRFKYDVFISFSLAASFNLDWKIRFSISM